jgi:tRNA(Ile2) C34 agmatinyltransferase TiaS
MTLENKILCGFCRTYFFSRGGFVCPDCEKDRLRQAQADRTAALERQYRMMVQGEI